MAYIELELTLIARASGEEVPICFRIDQGGLAQKWAFLLSQHLLARSLIAKNYLFHGWPKGPRNLRFLCAEMNQHIGRINRFFSVHPSLSYEIDLLFDPENLSRELLNCLHRHFENLIGQLWSPAKYFAAAPPEIRYSISQINLLCHEIESCLNQGGCARLVFAFPRTRRFGLRDVDFEQFSPNLSWGDVYLHYAQLGKDHLEVFFDRDEDVGAQNISGLRYISGEFDVHLSPTENREVTLARMEKFRSWMRNRNLDPDDRSLAIGYAVVAKLDRERSGGVLEEEFMASIFRTDDLSRVRLFIADDKVIECRYDYHWSDNDFAARMTELYRG